MPGEECGSLSLKGDLFLVGILLARAGSLSTKLSHSYFELCHTRLASLLKKLSKLSVSRTNIWCPKNPYAGLWTIQERGNSSPTH